LVKFGFQPQFSFFLHLILSKSHNLAILLIFWSFATRIESLSPQVSKIFFGFGIYDFFLIYILIKIIFEDPKLGYDIIIPFYNLIWWDYSRNYSKNIKLNTKFISKSNTNRIWSPFISLFLFFLSFPFSLFFYISFLFFSSISSINKKIGLPPHLFIYSYE